MGANASSQLEKEINSDSFANEHYYGLVNFGNTCYCNSVIQALYFCQPFREKILQYKQQLKKSGNQKENLLTCLADLFHSIATQKRRVGTIAPKKFISKLKKENELFDNYMQQDAHEFLNYLLNTISETLIEETRDRPPTAVKNGTLRKNPHNNPQPEHGSASANGERERPRSDSQPGSCKTGDTTWVQDIFQGTLTNETRCLNCETVSSKDEDFLDLSVDVDQNASITHCLRVFSNTETLCGEQKYYCETCCSHQEAQKRMRIKKLPRMLALHLKRFKYMDQLSRYTKLSYRVLFPLELRLFNVSDDAVNADRLYDLCAVVVHCGATPNRGHYITVVKSNNFWLLFDDDIVDKIDSSAIEDFFGLSEGGLQKNSESAYILFYKVTVPFVKLELHKRSQSVKVLPSPSRWKLLACDNDGHRLSPLQQLSRMSEEISGGANNNMDESTHSNNSNEVVYGSGSPLAGESGDSGRTMSEKVQTLAASIYRELEKMIHTSGEDSVKTIMPLVVNVLECLDMAYLEKEEMHVDLEMLKEDNEQLITQYEREKQLRKQQDQKYMEIEDQMITQQRELEGKIESLESIMRMLELKAKNAADHSQRLEERETDQRAEFDRLHERYNVLLRTHIDHMERTKYLMGSDKFEMMQNMPLPSQQMRNKMGGVMAASVDASSIRGVSDLISAHHMTHSISHDVDLAHHISNEVDYRDEFGEVSDVEPSPRDTSSDEQRKREEERGDSEQVQLPETAGETEQQESEMTTSLHNPALVNEPEPEDSLGADLTGNLVDPAEFASAEECASLFEDDIDYLLPPATTSTSLRYSNNATSSPSSRSSRQHSFTDCETLSGMGREVENLIKENTELLDMKNALNIVKNDLIARVDELSSEQEILREEVHSLEMVRAKMSEQMQKTEDELKEAKRKLAEKEAEHEEEDVPLAQRKRFTRSEMQRVLIDRNMYKERLMELEESLKWTEMQRAKKSQQPQTSAKQGKGIWDFFSGLFGESPSPTSGRPRSRPSDDPTNRKHKMTKSVDFIDPDLISERRAAERREQYKLVREHVKKDDSGRLQAYGWSIPSSVDTSATQVPVPVCCRPVLEQLPQLKVWCGTGVILRGGKLPDGTYISGEAVYMGLTQRMPPRSSDAQVVDGGALEEEIERSQALEARERDLLEWAATSLVWVASSNQGRSQIAIVDANNPNNVIDQFAACDSHLLCMTSVPGVLEDEPWTDEAGARKLLRGGGYVKEVPSNLDSSELGAVSWVELRVLDEADDGVETLCSNEQKPSPRRTRDFSLCEQAAVPGPSEGKPAVSSSPREPVIPEGGVPDTGTLPVPAGEGPVPPLKVLALEKEEQVSDEVASPRGALPTHVRSCLSRYEKVAANIDTKQPTIWMGSQNQYIYIHSSVTSWRQCLRRIKLPDAVLSIVFTKGRVFAALANGTIAVFHRDKLGNWSAEGYHSIRIGSPSASVRSLEVVGQSIWAAYKNCVVVIDVHTLHVEKVLCAHPRKDSQVRAMQWIGTGVWLTIRLDSTIRLFNAFTYEHLQDVDIEPYVTRMLGTSKLDFSYMRTTSLLISNRRMWIGTGTGVVICVPLSSELEEKVQSSLTGGGDSAQKGPGGLVRVYKSDTHEKKNCPSLFVPYCNLSQAQLSFHGHKDSVKFFLAVPGEDKSSSGDDSSEDKLRRMLVVSGGDGYIDFRMGEEEPTEEIVEDKEKVRVRDMSHLIIWELDAELPILSSS